MLLSKSYIIRGYYLIRGGGGGGERATFPGYTLQLRNNFSWMVLTAGTVFITKQMALPARGGTDLPLWSLRVLSAARCSDDPRWLLTLEFDILMLPLWCVWNVHCKKPPASKWSVHHNGLLRRTPSDSCAIADTKGKKINICLLLGD